MSDDRLTMALDRLERALARIEEAGVDLDRVAERQGAARDTLQSQIERLEARHRRLRASTASAIEQLDGLMSPAAGAPHG